MENPIIEVSAKSFLTASKVNKRQRMLLYIWFGFGQPLLIIGVWLAIVFFLYSYLLNSHDLLSNLNRLGDYSLIIISMGIILALWFALRYLWKALIMMRNHELQQRIGETHPQQAHRIVKVMHDEAGNITHIQPQ